MIFDHRFERIHEPGALLRQGGVEWAVAADNAAANGHFPGSPTALELPSVKGSRGLRAKCDAFVAQEILGPLRRAMARQVLRGSDDYETKRVGEPNLHHVTLNRLAQAHAGVVALRHDVDEAILNHDLDLDSRVTISKLRQHRFEHEWHGHGRDRQPDPSDGFARLC